MAGTLADLRRIRGRWADMTATAAQLSQLGYAEEAARLAADAGELAQTVFEVPVRCILCLRTEPLPVIVGEPGAPEPNTLLCGACNLLTTAEALAVNG